MSKTRGCRARSTRPLAKASKLFSAPMRTVPGGVVGVEPRPSSVHRGAIKWTNVHGTPHTARTAQLHPRALRLCIGVNWRATV